MTITMTKNELVQAVTLWLKDRGMVADPARQNPQIAMTVYEDGCAMIELKDPPKTLRERTVLHSSSATMKTEHDKA